MEDLEEHLVVLFQLLDNSVVYEFGEVLVQVDQALDQQFLENLLVLFFEVLDELEITQDQVLFLLFVSFVLNA